MKMQLRKWMRWSGRAVVPVIASIVASNAMAARVYTFTGTVTQVTLGSITVVSGGDSREFDINLIPTNIESPWTDRVREGDRVTVRYTLEAQDVAPADNEKQAPGKRGVEKNPLEGIMDDRAFFEARNDHMCAESRDFTGT